MFCMSELGISPPSHCLKNNILVHEGKGDEIKKKKSHKTKDLKIVVAMEDGCISSCGIFQY